MAVKSLDDVSLEY